MRKKKKHNRQEILSKERGRKGKKGKKEFPGEAGNPVNVFLLGIYFVKKVLQTFCLYLMGHLPSSNLYFSIILGFVTL